MTTNHNPAQIVHAPFTFTGRGGEYFRIWIVNLALTILTLGIYSAWAKVRRLQYFYRNTSLAGASFDYHGQPLAILKGRIIGVALLAAYHFSTGINNVLTLAAVLVLFSVLPWLVQRSMCFRLYNTSYRGLRFHFTGSLGGAYKAFLAWPLAGYLTAGLLFPLAHQRMKAYQHGSSKFGTTGFAFHAGAKPFYGIYLKLGLMMILFLVLAVVLLVLMMKGGADFLLHMDKPYHDKKEEWTHMGLLILTVMGFYMLALVFIGPWFNARMQNLVWNATTLGPHGFVSNVRARDLLAIYLTNFLGILLTFGLFKPFADIRLARYRLRHMALRAEGELDDFLADQAQRISATGEETADVFDFDISF